MSTHERGDGDHKEVSDRAAALYEAHLRACVQSLNIESARDCTLKPEDIACPSVTATDAAASNRRYEHTLLGISTVASVASAGLLVHGHPASAAVLLPAVLIGPVAHTGRRRNRFDLTTPVAHASFHATRMLHSLPVAAVPLAATLTRQVEHVQQLARTERTMLRRTGQAAAVETVRREAFARAGTVAVVCSFLDVVGEHGPHTALAAQAHTAPQDPWVFLTDLGHVLAQGWLEVTGDVG